MALGPGLSLGLELTQTLVRLNCIPHAPPGFYNEDGDPIHVCMFDADITIDGLPYRTGKCDSWGSYQRHIALIPALFTS